MESRKKFWSSLFLVALYSVMFTNCRTSDEETFLKIVMKCLQKNNVAICLKWTAANALSNIMESEEPLAITNYLTLVKRPGFSGNSSRDAADKKRALDLKSWESEEVKNEKLDNFIWKELETLLTTRTIQIALPNATFEGREKLGKIFKKSHGTFLLFLTMILKAGMAKIAFIAGKALVMAKIALVISLIVGLRRFLGRGNLDAELIYNAEQEANGWQRRFALDSRRDNHYGPHHLAYNAHAPLRVNKV